MSTHHNNQDPVAADEWADAPSQPQAGVDSGQEEESTSMFHPQAVLEELEADPGNVTKDINLELILDIPVTMAMEIGRTRISIRNLLQLNQGSVVELDRLAGEPLDVLVNGCLIAHGELVVVNEKFGIRLTDVISASERVKRLK
ncbi:flagellar motor switch protein FliN [Nitrosococcus oceani]|uniref:Flagellar motor switch protein FliN n=2 Tax=Nitrosococcus oceani TaxID=1229 RepID=Q3J972_NITOC|nr:flagellar motor switch protein FliN [Nitrosococcus oceani]KFI18925.1 flagellar motor switch protein FliN [Nitrosococcus oceani C-27]ABA58624.1 Surface presentation of antigens (SPOA) protein [Nitrosococcus oceani ATCC 19707]EDZ68127.1 flagellar motor switch protein FliN [Nitrosococcus oceani AFC27]KFI22207.1 flagellar motor switch protein FliN [Nitrosococcus oceani]GEM19744.1 flagellar motor switch protein FliN [Nitrosococcus oceani]